MDLLHLELQCLHRCLDLPPALFTKGLLVLQATHQTKPSKRETDKAEDHPVSTETTTGPARVQEPRPGTTLPGDHPTSCQRTFFLLNASGECRAAAAGQRLRISPIQGCSRDHRGDRKQPFGVLPGGTLLQAGGSCSSSRSSSFFEPSLTPAPPCPSSRF